MLLDAFARLTARMDPSAAELSLAWASQVGRAAFGVLLYRALGRRWQE
jgi:hypothetical protein